MSNEQAFTFKVPIVKYWEEEISVEKSAGKVEKDNQRFIQVVVSGLKEDRDGEQMSKEAIDFMEEQFKSGTIPFFPDHGRTETGDKFYSWKQMMGVWVDSFQEKDELFAVVRLNKSHPDHNLLWNYIKEGMPLAFSIGGKPRNPPEIIEVEDNE